MPTVHEILKQAPEERQQLVSVENFRSFWGQLKAYEPALSSSGKLVVRSHIIAAIMHDYRDVRESLLTYDQCAYFLQAVAAAKARIDAMPGRDATAKAIYDHVLANSSPF